MIQTQTIESVETALQLGLLIPKDAKPKSRHRFWVGRFRIDAYLNPKRILFVHWLERRSGKWVHPRGNACYRAIVFPDGRGIYLYPDGKKTEFQISEG